MDKENKLTKSEIFDLIKTLLCLFMLVYTITSIPTIFKYSLDFAHYWEENFTSEEYKEYKEYIKNIRRHKNECN